MLKDSVIIPEPANNLLSFVRSHTGENVSSRYQCGKCSAGCPSAFTMDLTPRQIMRAIQLGLKDEVLKSSAIWVCLSCQTCTLRCPREIDIAKVIEAMRFLSLTEKKATAEKGIVIFYDSFLQQVRLFGRLYEMGLGAMYNMRSMRPFDNMKRLPTLFSKGKLKMKPQMAGRAEVKKIAARAKEIESELEKS